LRLWPYGLRIGNRVRSGGARSCGDPRLERESPSSTTITDALLVIAHALDDYPDAVVDGPVGAHRDRAAVAHFGIHQPSMVA
jgi:hypothetical protein